MPAADDTEGWLRVVEAGDESLRARFAAHQPDIGALERDEMRIGGVPTYVLRPPGLTDDGTAPIVVEIHEGGLLLGGGELAGLAAARRASRREAVTWAPDYRMPPSHPYPAALDDCITVYRQALAVQDPSKIIVSGASAGGNLAAALLLRAKDEGLPMPAGLVLLTPELDLTESGDSFRTNIGIDLLPLLAEANRLYAAGHELTHPYLSPLFGDVDGLPPTFLQTGTRDLYLSNAVRMHRRLLDAGVPVELHVLEAAPHGGFGGLTPEDGQLLDDIRRFEQHHLTT